MKKIISMLTAAAVCVTCFSFGGTALAAGEDYGGRYVPLEVESIDSAGEFAQTLPSAYDMRDEGIVPEVRSQSPYGTCWTFSMMAASETASAKSGIADSSIDFSELHMAYYTYRSSTDPMGLTAGDKNVTNPTNSILNYAGNNFVGLMQLAKWSGYQLESDMPYSEAEKADSVGLEASREYTKNSYVLKDSALIDSSTNRDMIKKYLMQMGAASIIYNHLDEYYNPNTYAYYYDGQLTTNHLVSVVGWNDNFPRTSFVSGHRPSKNGAWLCRNSWTENWGDNGYFWISYEDTCLANNIFIFAQPEVVRGVVDNYQYDGNGSANSTYINNGEKAANVFTAQQTEALYAASITTMSANVRYSLQLYSGVTGDDPESGVPMLSEPVTGEFEAAGLHSVDLPEQKNITEGQRFSVVFTLESDDGMVSCNTDANANWGWLAMKGTAKAGQSYLCNSRGWYDYGKSENCNLRIKAYAIRNLNAPKLSYTNVNSSTVQVSWTKSGTATGYQLFRKEKGTDKWVNVKNTYAGRTFTDTTVTPGKYYYYMVRGINSTTGEKSGFSNITTAYACPGAPATLKVTAKSSSSITIKWSAANNAAGYRIVRYTAGSGEAWKGIKLTSATSFKDTTVKKGKTYYYRVQAYEVVNGKNMVGKYSPSVSATAK